MGSSESSPALASDTANVHVDLLGEERVISVTVALGRRTPLELLPAARELTNQLVAVTVDHARAEGREISCRAGCGACCRQLVAIAPVEALRLAELVGELPPERQAVIRSRFADALHRLEAAGLLDANTSPGQRSLLLEDVTDAGLFQLFRTYFELGIPCPFLVDESCGIHAERPLICREFHVTSLPEYCQRPFEQPVVPVLPRLHMGRALAESVAHFAETVATNIPLVLSLEWAASFRDRLHRQFDGQAMFQALLQAIDPEQEKPFAQRQQP